MFTVDLQSKRAKLALRFFTYGVMTVSTIIISAFCILLALGYRFDNSSLSFEQGGLIQFRSTPQNATLVVDGKRQNFTTPGKLTVEAGRHDVTMQLEGYRDWRKTVDIEAGQLLWLNYTRFVPNDITTNGVREFEQLAGALISPNRQFAVFLPKANQPLLTFADLRNEQDVQFVDATIPAGAYTVVPGVESRFELIEWQLNGRYLLVRHTAGDAVNEVLRVDREQPQEAINISAKYGPIGQVQFLGDNSGVVVGIINGELRRMEVTGTESRPLVAGVTSFELYRDSLIGFIAERDGVRKVGVLKNNRETVIDDIPLDDAMLKIDVTNYFNDDYLAISHGKSVRIIRNPAEASVATPRADITFDVKDPSVEWLYFSNNGRMLVAQHQASFTTYDLELAETHHRSFSTDEQVTRPFKFFDDYNLSVDLGGNLRIVEFDGTNERSLTGMVEGFPVSLSDSGDNLFTVGKNSSNGRFVLQRSNMIVEQ